MSHSALALQAKAEALSDGICPLHSNLAQGCKSALHQHRPGAGRPA